MQLENRKNFLVNFTFIITVLGVIYFALKFMLAYLLPFMIGIFISYLIQKPAELLSKKLNIKKGICAAALSVVSFLILLAVFSVLVWIIVSQANSLINSVAKNTNTLKLMYEKTGELLKRFTNDIPSDMQSVIKNLLTDFVGEFATKTGTFLTGSVTALIKKMPTLFISVIVTFVATCYISKDFDRLKKFFKNMIKVNTYKNILTIKTILFECCFKFLKGYLLIILITFFELLIGFLLLGVEHFLLLALLISLIDILPIFGTGTVLIPWSVILFLQEKYFFAIGILILYLLVTVVRNIIEPKIIGDKIGINPLFTLLAIFLGLRLAGIAGMIILPIAAIVVISFYKQQIEEEKLRTQ